MSIRCRVLAGWPAVALVLAFVSCAEVPTSPRPTQQPPVPVVPMASLLRFELIEPPEIPPGEVVQLTANAIRSDGSVENVSSQALWQQTNSSVLQLSSTGLATGKTRGMTVVTAYFSGRSARATVLVLPKNTFRLAGRVQDSGFGIADVTVTVISGVGEGLTTRTDGSGSYALYGVSGPVEVNLQKQGYRNTIDRLDVAGHHTTDFNMTAERPPTGYTGAYQLTISAASSCLGGTTPFPDAARRRVYTATVAQEVARLTVTLTDADFIVTNGFGNRFFGFVDPTDTITFTLSNGDYYYELSQFDVVERFSNTALMTFGRATARGTPQIISGSLAGTLQIASEASAPFTGIRSECRSNTHGFEMVRR